MMKSESSLPSSPRPGRRPVVVCIDDDPATLSALRRVLRSDRYDLLTTVDPEEALDRILRPPVDVFITDERMPGITGTDLLRVVEQQSPATRRVMISAYPEPAGRLRSDRSLVQHFIPKPWNDELLRAIVGRMTAGGVSAETRRANPKDDDFMREIPILADCSGCKIFQIVPGVLRQLRRARREGRAILAVLEGLGQLQEDPGALLADLELGVTAAGVSLCLVDASGLAERYRRLRGDPSPLLSVHGPDPGRPSRSFLLVDPSAPRRVFLKLLLSGLGHSCRAVGSAEEARPLVEGEPFDAILVDLSEPQEMMGWIEELSVGEMGQNVVPLLPPTRRWDPAVFDRWQLRAPLIRPYAVREILELTA